MDRDVPTSPIRPIRPPGGHAVRTRSDPRWETCTAVAGLGAIIVIHLLGLSDRFAEVPLIGVAYVVVIAAAIASISLLAQSDPRGWLVGGALCLATIAAYVLSRTIHLHETRGGVAPWSNPLGLGDLTAEATVVIIVIHRLVCDGWSTLAKRDVPREDRGKH